MNYIIGNVIPSNEISKRFRDEDGDVFIEIRGRENVLFRVNEEDRIYYKIDKSKIKIEQLTLIDDFSHLRPKQNDTKDPPPEKQPIIEEDEEYDLGTLWEIGSKSEKQKEVIKPEDIKEFNEGDRIPEHLESQCTRNEYGGYNLRFNHYLYLLDNQYYVEYKNPDTATRYSLEDGPILEPSNPWETDVSGDIFNLTDPIMSTETEKKNSEEDIEIQLQVGDILPTRLRSKCESQLGSEVGSRIILGNYLYMMDAGFKIIRKMKISYVQEEENNSQLNIKNDSTKSINHFHKESSIPEIITNLITVFGNALESFKISAEYFKNTVLHPNHLEILQEVYQGNLQKLNDDTIEATAQGKNLIIPSNKAGFNLLKSALIHELYIKSTLSGRGDNMKYFLTYITATHPDGKMGELHENISMENQQSFMDFFKSRALVYTDKTEIIRRVFIQLRNTIYSQYKELWLNKENVLFNALLICKLYENTTRLDRGDGITMICLTQDLLEYQPN